jgi:hypothetical protein
LSVCGRRVTVDRKNIAPVWTRSSPIADRNAAIAHLRFIG